MSHTILVGAEGESAETIGALVAGQMPSGFVVARDRDRAGLNVDPVSVALIASGGAVLSTLITTLGAMWTARVNSRKEKAPAGSGGAGRATVTISTHDQDIVIHLGRDAAAAVAAAQLPADPADVVEIRLGVG